MINENSRHCVSKIHEGGGEAWIIMRIFGVLNIRSLYCSLSIHVMPLCLKFCHAAAIGAPVAKCLE